MAEDVDYNIKMSKEEIIKEIVGWIVTIIICLVLAKIITSFLIINARVPSASMENTILTNDRIIANRFANPNRFDVMVFKAPDEPETPYVKRVIGMPGDTVEIIEGQLFINGELIQEDYIKEPMIGSFGPYDVPEGSYFMMGDNRNNSFDSRYWENTYVPEDTILGEAEFAYFPKVKRIN